MSAKLGATVLKLLVSDLLSRITTQNSRICIRETHIPGGKKVQ